MRSMANPNVTQYRSDPEDIHEVVDQYVTRALDRLFNQTVRKAVDKEFTDEETHEEAVKHLNSRRKAVKAIFSEGLGGR